MAFCFASGVDSYTLYPNVPSEPLNKELIVPFPEMLELADGLFPAYSSLCPTRIVDITIPCFSDSSVYAKWKDLLAIRLHSCAAAQYALKITSDGRVSACICQASDPFIIGDLNSESLDDIWTSEKAGNFRSLYKQIPECSACTKRDMCRGGCRNNASLFGTKGLYSLDPYCRFLGSRIKWLDPSRSLSFGRKKRLPGDEEKTFSHL
jgi:radical SAM protein with 4Fe4S-binding SPASM domain